MCRTNCNQLGLVVSSHEIERGFQEHPGLLDCYQQFGSIIWGKKSRANLWISAVSWFLPNPLFSINLQETQFCQAKKERFFKSSSCVLHLVIASTISSFRFKKKNAPKNCPGAKPWQRRTAYVEPPSEAPWQHGWTTTGWFTNDYMTLVDQLMLVLYAESGLFFLGKEIWSFDST